MGGVSDGRFTITVEQSPVGTMTIHGTVRKTMFLLLDGHGLRLFHAGQPGSRDG